MQNIPNISSDLDVTIHGSEIHISAFVSKNGEDFHHTFVVNNEGVEVFAFDLSYEARIGKYDAKSNVFLTEMMFHLDQETFDLIREISSNELEFWRVICFDLHKIHSPS